MASSQQDTPDTMSEASADYDFEPGSDEEPPPRRGLPASFVQDFVKCAALADEREEGRSSVRRRVQADAGTAAAEHTGEGIAAEHTSAEHADEGAAAAAAGGAEHATEPAGAEHAAGADHADERADAAAVLTDTDWVEIKEELLAQLEATGEEGTAAAVEHGVQE
eukprot:1860471-Alexandrium_andersonii.AAC.1